MPGAQELLSQAGCTKQELRNLPARRRCIDVHVARSSGSRMPCGRYSSIVGRWPRCQAFSKVCSCSRRAKAVVELEAVTWVADVTRMIGTSLISAENPPYEWACEKAAERATCREGLLLGRVWLG